LIAAIGDEAQARAQRSINVDVRSSKHLIQLRSAALRRIDPNRPDCAAVMVSDVPEVRSELARLARAGVRILSLVSDVRGPGRNYLCGA